jgi:hypothetical protein
MMPDDVPKIVYVIKVETLRPAVNTIGMSDNVSSSNPKFQDVIEHAPANLQTVNDSMHWKNSLIMHLHCSKFQVTRDFMEAHSVI